MILIIIIILYVTASKFSRASLIVPSALTAFGTNENLGSPSKVYDLLVAASKAHPVAGNAEGSYLTMRSKEGAVFFVINIVGNFVSQPFLFPPVCLICATEKCREISLAGGMLGIARLMLHGSSPADKLC